MSSPSSRHGRSDARSKRSPFARGKTPLEPEHEDHMSEGPLLSSPSLPPHSSRLSPVDAGQPYNSSIPISDGRAEKRLSNAAKSQQYQSRPGAFPRSSSHAVEDAASSGSTPMKSSTIRPPVSPYSHHRRDSRIPTGSNSSRFRRYSQDSFERQPSFRAFDSLSCCGVSVSDSQENVLYQGYEGGLDVFIVTHDKIELLASLSGFQGSVTQAKILPSHRRHDDLRTVRPLIAVVLNGSTRPNEAHFDTGTILENDICFQTTVDVYSLKTAELITTLYKSDVFEDPDSCPGSSAGSLELEAQGKFLTITAAASGEIFVFNLAQSNISGSKTSFRCVGKFWTTVQESRVRQDSRSPSFTEGTISSNAPTRLSRSPVYSLSPRWLAILPPAALSTNSVQGSASVSPPGSKPPGITSAVPPHPPDVDATVVTEAETSVLDRVARGAAQELLKGAQWANSQGMQAWQRYWGSAGRAPNEPSSSGVDSVDERFPPTHAAETSTEESGSKLVSIIDLESLAAPDLSKQRDFVVPLATFVCSNGCSYLSFSPSGMTLMTVSYRGNYQQIWNLFSILSKDGSCLRSKSAFSRGSSNSSGPLIHEVGHFKRLTDARIVDIAWTHPLGGQVALMTSRGTVHVFDVPSQAMELSLPKKKEKPTGVTSVHEASNQGSTAAESQQTVLPLRSPNMLSSAFRSISGITQPLISAVRERTDSSLGGWNFTTGQTIRSGKAIASEVGRSINQLGGVELMRIRTSLDRIRVQRGCMLFATGTERGYLAILSNKSLCFHSLSKPRNTADSSKPVDLAMPATTSGSLDGAYGYIEGSPLVTGNWRLPGKSDDSPPPPLRSLHPLSYAEIETQSRFQPFHLSRICNLYTYKHQEPWESASQVDDDDDGNSNMSPWGFGVEIPTMKLDTEMSTLTNSSAIVSDVSGMDRIVVRNTNRSIDTSRTVPDTGANVPTGRREDEFFEEGCTVLDLAEDNT